MEQSKEILFIEKLSSDTVAQKIKWERATKHEGFEYDSRPDLAALFMQNEFRHVDFYDSYFAQISTGFVYLVNVSSESGRDGSRIHGYEFYIEDSDDRLFSMHAEQGLLYQLANAIHSYMAIVEKPAEAFIDAYLNS